jgi:hypothetical protein
VRRVFLLLGACLVMALVFAPAAMAQQLTAEDYGPGDRGGTAVKPISISLPPPETPVRVPELASIQQSSSLFKHWKGSRTYFSASSATDSAFRCFNRPIRR